jgi:hypothetical protein
LDVGDPTRVMPLAGTVSEPISSDVDRMMRVRKL